VATELATDFDLGPLSWVQQEIDQSLARGLDALAALRANAEDRSHLKHARAHVHQAAGAIQMVGLDAVVAFTDEVERNLARLEDLPAAAVPAAVDLLDRACRKLRIFLDETVGGIAPVPLRLFPEYEAMQHARGVRAAAPTDLFYPDLTARAPRIAQRDGVPASRMPSVLIKQRRQYQRGLLAWLRGDAGGAATMREAIAGIEDVATQSSLRTFWWTVGALFEGLAGDGLETGFGVKQLAARIDLQIRRVAEGSAKVADRLRREVLYHVAIAAPVGPQLQAVQRAYRLQALIPTPEAIGTDVVGLMPKIREAREQLASAKDTWLKFASGRAENLPKLKQTLTSVHNKAAEMKHGALMKLTSALVERLDKLPAAAIPEPVAMEFATALLLAESAFENYSNLAADFPRQVDQMIGRLDAARAGRVPADGGAPVLDEMSRRAQERVLIAQVGREIQANLRHMEQVLDAFFRDNSKRADLESLRKDSEQVRGALAILGLDDAERLLGMCQAQIETYLDPEVAVSDEDLELLAESLSGLGFYIEAVEQQRPERDRLIAPLIAKRLGEASNDAPVESDSVEQAVLELRAALPRLLEEVQGAPADRPAREGLRAKLVALRDDAELIGDTELVRQAGEALAAFDADGAADDLAAVVEAIADTATPLPEISEETQRLLEVDASGLDAELLEIYLAEAGEVLETIRGSLSVLDGNRGDRDALATVRRGFHTLKGSGRMVGLADLGEYAYDVEKIHNRLLEEQRPVTAAVLSLIGTAASAFRGWVDALSAHGRVTCDPAALHAAIRAVEAELPGGESVIGPARAAPQPGPEVAYTIVSPDPAAIEIEVTAPAHEEQPLAVAAANAPAHDVETVSRQHEGDLPELGTTMGGELPLIEVEPGEEGGADAPRSGPYDAHHRARPAESPAHGVTLKLVADNTRTAASVQTADPVCDAALPRGHEPRPTPAGVERATCAEDRDAHAPEIGAATVDEASVPESSAANAGEALAGTEASAPAAEPAATAEPEDVTIGEVTLSASLWRILVDEAGHHVATLDHEQSLLQFDPTALPSQAMIRAAHTLCGIHRTGGFQPVAAIAKSLELALIALAQAEARPASALPVIARAVEALRRLVRSVEARNAFRAGDAQEAIESQDELDALRQHAAQHPELDAETAAAHAALSDEEASAPGAASAASPVPEIVLPAPEADPLAGIHDEVEDPQVLSIFLEEAAELFPAAGDQLRRWQRAPHDGASAQDLRRTLHTFKGSARMAGAMRLGELTHLMESRLLDGDGLAAATPELFEALETDLDRIAYVLDKLREGQVNVALPWLAAPDEAPLVDPTVAAATSAPEASVPATGAAAPLEAAASPASPERANVPAPVAEPPVREAAAAPAHAADASAPAVSPTPATPATGASATTPVPAVPAPAAAATAARPEPADGDAGPRAMLRVRADTIDRLVNEAGEVAIARARIEGELRGLKANLLELTNSVIRLRTQVREIEIQAESQIQSRMTQMHEHAGDFDPLEFDRYTRFQELTRSLAEGVNDVSTVQQALLKNIDDADAALLAQSRLSRDMQQQLFAIRTVPFSSLSERLYRIVRQVAKELGKRVNLEIVGAQTELDRSVLEKLAGPLEHLLRNALDHGIETREARREAGKSETGEITLAVRQSGNEIEIELADDGAGIDLARVRDKAVAQGLVPGDSMPSERQLLDCIFRPGFSTASRVTAISGRGVGMDVVRAELAGLGGRVEVATEPGRGTRFTLALPLTLAVAQAVLIRAGGRLWALPAPMVEQVQQVREDALYNLYVAREVEWMGRRYPFHYLPRLVGDTAHHPETQRYNAVLLLKSGHGACAVHVDEMVGKQEIVVKNIGPQLARVSGVAGATVLGTGEIVLIINPVQLAERADVPTLDPAGATRVVAAAPAAQGQPLVMIVDDSLTVRKITSRLLVREGFRVATAKDGLDALQAIAEEIPDVILLDIEMPRMDGFEFTKTLKSDPAHAHIPIVMITSRTADKHRARAAELGVDLYLGKPYQEEELLRNLREMLGVAAVA
jgi:chemosensory pili system protein ChpA (sensor histidine kinase/response regulator)